MPIRLDTRDADFTRRFAAFLAAKREASQDVEDAVKAIIADVVARGDEALVAEKRVQAAGVPVEDLAELRRVERVGLGAEVSELRLRGSGSQ